MKNFNPSFIIIAAIAVVFASCSNQRYVSGETDDIYYSSSDRAATNAQDQNTVKEVNGEDYKSVSEPQGGYYSLGKESSASDQNNRSEQAYANGMSAQQSENIPDGAATVNNFYGNTTYNEGGFVEDSYATRFRRFNNTNVAIGYYDPFFVDPYWNMGWGWNRPMNGWNVGWNSWGGWNVGYNVGWGYPAWGFNNYWSWNRWNNPYWNNSPWNNCWGPGWGNNWGPGYGWGRNGWNNGYAWGYRDGFNDGFYGAGRGFNQTPSRPIIRGRAPVAGNDGFSSQTVERNQSDSRSHTQDDRLNNEKFVGREAAKSKGDQMASTERLDRSNNIYQVNRSGANPRAEAASNQYSNAVRSNAKDKYSVQTRNRPNATASGSGTVSSQNSSDRSRANAQYNSGKSQNSYSGSNRATYGDRRPNASQVNRPTNTNRGEVRSRSNATPRNSGSSESRARTNTQRSTPRQYAPAKTQNNSNYRPRTNAQPRRSTTTQPSQRTRSRATTPRTSPSRTAPSRSSQSTTRTAPSRSQSRSYSSPQRSAPSRSMSSPSPSRSRSGASSPSRSGGRR